MEDSYIASLDIHDDLYDLLRGRIGPELDARIRALVPTGIYEHFKSTPESRKYYAVYGVAPGVNDDRKHEYIVAYEALYPPHTGELSWRELIGRDGFLMPINRPEVPYRGPRFTLVEACTRAELAGRALRFRT